jgi:hypothetical protein
MSSAEDQQAWPQAGAAVASLQSGPLVSERLEALRKQNPQMSDLLLKPLLAFLLTAAETSDGDLDLHIILLTIAIRTVQHSDFPNLSMRDRIEGVPVFPNVGVNALSIAESSGVPRETVRRKVAELVRKGWLARQGSRLHFTSKGFRETTLVREAMERLAVQYCEIIGAELQKLPDGLTGCDGKDGGAQHSRAEPDPV